MLQGWQRRHCPKGKGKVVTLTSAKGLSCPSGSSQTQGLHLDDDSKQNGMTGIISASALTT